jgi:DNA modification methylase
MPDFPCLDRWKLFQGDALSWLAFWPDECVDLIVTSPPYYHCRDYGVDGQIGLEATPEAFIGRLVEVFRECRRVLKKAGSMYIVIGDTYAGSGGSGGDYGKGGCKEGQTPYKGTMEICHSKRIVRGSGRRGCGNAPATGKLKPKDIIGIPYMLAFALRDNGWWCRQPIIWDKLNPRIESVKDRFSSAFEVVLFLTKSQFYYFDQASILEPYVRIEGDNPACGLIHVPPGASPDSGHGKPRSSFYKRGGKNKKNVWHVSVTKPYKRAGETYHCAQFPPKLIKPCILASCPKDGTVLDPFCGVATTGAVALQHGCRFIGIDINAEYIETSRKRLEDIAASLKGKI